MGPDGVDDPKNDDTTADAVVLDDAPKDGAVAPDGEQSSESTEDAIVDVVLEGDGSQPKAQNFGVRKRINKLNARNREAEDRAAARDRELQIEREKVKLLELSNEQLRTQTTPTAAIPDPDDYDDGVADPRYQSAHRAYTDAAVAAAIQNQTPAPQTQTQVRPAPSEAVERKQTQHYERAAELKVTDYEDAEDAAVEIIGNNTASQLISVSDKSHMILYYLGKNPREAENFAALVESNPTEAAVHVGRLEERLKIQPRAGRKPPPEPDEQLAGGSSASGSAYEKGLDALREKAAGGTQKDIDALQAYKRKHREQAA